MLAHRLQRWPAIDPAHYVLCLLDWILGARQIKTRYILALCMLPENWAKMKMSQYYSSRHLLCDSINFDSFPHGSM